MKKLIIQKNNEIIVLPEINSVVDALSKKQDKTSLSTVATTGDYNDLINTPTTPTIPNVTDNVSDGNMNPVTSNAVYDYIDSIIGDINDYITS